MKIKEIGVPEEAIGSTFIDLARKNAEEFVETYQNNKALIKHYNIPLCNKKHKSPWERDPTINYDLIQKFSHNDQYEVEVRMLRLCYGEEKIDCYAPHFHLKSFGFIGKQENPFLPFELLSTLSQGNLVIEYEISYGFDLFSIEELRDYGVEVHLEKHEKIIRNYGKLERSQEWFADELGLDQIRSEAIESILQINGRITRKKILEVLNQYEFAQQTPKLPDHAKRILPIVKKIKENGKLIDEIGPFSPFVRSIDWDKNRFEKSLDSLLQSWVKDQEDYPSEYETTVTHDMTLSSNLELPSFSDYELYLPNKYKLCKAPIKDSTRCIGLFRVALNGKVGPGQNFDLALTNTERKLLSSARGFEGKIKSWTERTEKRKSGAREWDQVVVGSRSEVELHNHAKGFEVYGSYDLDPKDNGFEDPLRFIVLDKFLELWDFPSDSWDVILMDN